MHTTSQKLAYLENVRLYLIKSIYKILQKQSLYIRKFWKAFPLRIGMRHGSPLSSFLFDIVLEVLAISIIKMIKNYKDYKKMLEWIVYIFVYVNDPNRLYINS